MKCLIDIIIANPAGNVTVFVLTPFDRNQYQAVAEQLLAVEEFNAEQVAFIIDDHTMEMCGQEFCGNASRSFALIVAHKHHIASPTTIEIQVSGSNIPLHVAVDISKNYTKINMPIPLAVSNIDSSLVPFITDGTLVDLGGILHLVVKDIEPEIETFNKIKDILLEKYASPAIGVMFYDTKHDALTPVVYVNDVETTYYEGSCGSGAVALAAALSWQETNGTFVYNFSQPAGIITTTVIKANNLIKDIFIEGPVHLSKILKASIDC